MVTGCKMTVSTIDFSQLPRATFFRRFASWVYDALVCMAIYMASGLVVMGISLALFQNGIINNNGFEHFSDFTAQSLTFKIVLNGIALSLISLFFIWFWKKGGQTIGMRAWRLYLYNDKIDQPISYRQAFIRLISACGGLGTVLSLIDIKNKLALQDRLSSSQILTLTKEANGEVYRHHKF